MVVFEEQFFGPLKPVSRPRLIIIPYKENIAPLTLLLLSGSGHYGR